MLHNVLAYLDTQKENLAELAGRLISIPSVNDGVSYEHDNEGNVQAFLQQTLAGFGLKTDLWCEDHHRRRPNLVATLPGNGGGKSLILNGHVDVVPAPDPSRWQSDPFRATRREGKLYGRGSSDMKGAVAAMAYAAKALRECGASLGGDLYLQFVCGEEANQAEELGTGAALRRGYRAPFAVVGEPTSLEVHTASVGLMPLELTIRGKAVHTSCRNQANYPQRYGVPCGRDVGVDALKKSLPFLDLLYRLEDELNLSWRDRLLGAGGYNLPDSQGVGVFSVNPALINGGTYRASMCDRVWLFAVILFPYGVAEEEIIQKVRAALLAQAATDSWFSLCPPEIKLPARKPWQPFYTDPEDPGVQALCRAKQAATGTPAVISGFRAVCDATYLSRQGIPSAVCGPGSLVNGVHGDDEFVEIDELLEAAKTYAAMALEYCAPGV